MLCKSMTLCFMANLEAIRPEWSFPKKNGKSNVRSDLPEFIDLKSQPKPLSFGGRGYSMDPFDPLVRCDGQAEGSGWLP